MLSITCITVFHRTRKLFGTRAAHHGCDVAIDVTRVGMVQLSLMLRVDLEARRQVDFAGAHTYSPIILIGNFVVTRHRRDVEPRCDIARSCTDLKMSYTRLRIYNQRFSNVC